MKALFIGMYPNQVNQYRNVFFQNLIYAIADAGVDCTVISPVPITKYRLKTARIPRESIQKTPKGNEIRVFYPRYISASSIQIGKYNTEKVSEALFENCVLSVLKQLANERFDFVYGHFILYGGLAAIKAGQVLGIPSFLAYGECDFESQVRKTYGYPTQKQIKGLTGIISVSSNNTNELRSLGIFNDVPILTAPNSVDLSMFCLKDKDLCRTRLNMPNEKFIVGFVGGFIERKGDKRLLEAINRISGVYAAFAGRGNNPPKGDKVVFCQALDHEDVCDFLNAVDIFCLPTLSEGCCNAVVEAMACGLPIISSDLPFNDDVLDENNSLRINPNSVDEIENAIKILYQDEALRQRAGKMALLKSREFDITKRAERIIDFIEKHMN